MCIRDSSYSGGGRATTDYDNTLYFDSVIALKGNATISSNTAWTGNLTNAEGDKLVDTSILSMNEKLMLYVGEQQISDQSVEVANITFNPPRYRAISTIAPKNSGVITAMENYPNSSVRDGANSNFSVQANVLTGGDVQISLEENANVSPNRGNIANGRYVRFVDSSSSTLNNNAFVISNVIFGDGNVTNTLTGYANIGPVVQLETSNITSNTNIVYIDEVKDANGRVLWQNEQANAQLGSYLQDFDIASNRFYSPTETSSNIFIDGVNLHANGKVNYVVLSENIAVSSNIAANTVINTTAVQAQFTNANTKVTTFTINDPGVSSNIASTDLTASIDDGLLVTTDANVSNFISGSSVYVNRAGGYTDTYILRKIEPSDTSAGTQTGKFLLDGFFTQPRSNTLTVNGAVTDSPNVILNGSLTNVQGGMLVSGTGVTAGTKVVDVTSLSNITLSANANISNGATLTFTEDTFGNADIVDSSIIVTTRENHEIPTDGTDKIVGRTLDLSLIHISEPTRPY